MVSKSYEQKIREASEAIRKVFSDTKPTKAETRGALKRLAEDIEIMLDSLGKD